MKVPFVGPSSTVRSIDADNQRAVNVYLEMDNASPRAPVALYGRPGMVLEYQFLSGQSSTGEVRALFPIEGGYYVFVSDSVYWIAGGVASLVGNIGTSTGRIGLASNGSQIIVVDGALGYVITTATNTIAVISDPDFPNGVTSASFQNGYFVVCGDGTGQFYINETANNGTAWNGLDFANAEGAPDPVIGNLALQNEQWIFGTQTIEIYTFTGNADFPLERSQNTFIEHGCMAAGTISKIDNTAYWLGQDSVGFGTVWRAQGYTPVRISTHAVEKAIQSYANVSDAFAFSFQQEGHLFYVLTFPSANATWVYDVATGLWFEWASTDQQTGQLNRWRANCFCISGQKLLVGDYRSPTIYSLDLNTYKDDTDYITRLRRTQTQSDTEQDRLFFTRLQVDMETGVGLATGQGSDPVMMMRYSNDGGHTWSNYKTSTIGRTGQYAARAEFRRLGAGRNRIWEISMTDPVKFAVLGGIVDVQKGTA